jgi:hypothetical protein
VELDVKGKSMEHKHYGIVVYFQKRRVYVIQIVKWKVYQMCFCGKSLKIVLTRFYSSIVCRFLLFSWSNLVFKAGEICC